MTGRYAHLDLLNSGLREAAHAHLAPVMVAVAGWRAEGATWQECADRAGAAGFTSRLGLPFTSRGLMIAFRRFRASEQSEQAVPAAQEAVL
jgi:hypothetical protein